MLASDQLVFCACDAAEVIDFELTGLVCTLVVFGGPGGTSEAAAYSRRSLLGLPIVIVRPYDQDDVAPSVSCGKFSSTLASLPHLVDGILAARFGTRVSPETK